MNSLAADQIHGILPLLGKKWEYKGTCISCIYISRKPMIQLEEQ
jgi:hypothetical protein